MKVLLTGATGYIGKRLLPVLIERGYEVVCCVRDKDRFNPSESVRSKIQIIEVDLLDAKSLEKHPYGHRWGLLFSPFHVKFWRLYFFRKKMCNKF